MPNDPHRNPRQRDSLLILAAAIGFGLLIYGILPGRAVAMNDDFGYLRSVLETIRYGRPWTDDFLEPWGYCLSVLSAGLFKLTGSFFVATVALQSVMGSLSFWLAARIAHDHGYRPLASIGIAAVLLTFPTVLWKQIEYTVLIVYVPCLLAAVWSAGRNRWGWFFLAWAIAVTGRQSAAAWLALPLLAGAQAAMCERKMHRLKLPVLLVLLGTGWFFLVKNYANVTHAQRFITGQMFTHEVNLPMLRSNLKIGLWILAVMSGCASLLARLLLPRSAMKPPRHSLARVCGVLVALGLLATLPSVANEVAMGYEHQFFENSWAAGYLKGLVVLAALGWSLAPPSFNLPLLGTALATLVLPSLRDQLWDYYLIDAALLAFFAFTPAAPNAGPAIGPDWLLRVQPTLGYLVLLGLLSFQIAATEKLKRHTDGCAAFNSVLEKALRAGRLKPSELSYAPFGFVGWHLLPYYLDHDGHSSADLAGFNEYVGRDSMEMRFESCSRQDASKERAGALVGDRVPPYSEIHSEGWFGYVRLTLLSSTKAQPANIPINWQEYHYLPFPLNDAEWRSLIEGKP